MIAKQDVIDFCYDLPRKDVQCAWAVSLELATLFTSADEVIEISNEKLAERIGYTSRSVINQKPYLTEQGYWEVVPVSVGFAQRSAWRATAKLIAAIEGATNV